MRWYFMPSQKGYIHYASINGNRYISIVSIYIYIYISYVHCANEQWIQMVLYERREIGVINKNM